MQEIDDREYFNFDYVNLTIHLNDKFKKKSLISHIKKNVHVINNLKIKILIDIDIIYSKNITISLQTHKFIINNYDILILIIYILVEFKINRIIKFHHIIIIFAYSIITILFKTKNVNLLNVKNYFL